MSDLEKLKDIIRATQVAPADAGKALANIRKILAAKKGSNGGDAKERGADKGTKDRGDAGGKDRKE